MCPFSNCLWTFLHYHDSAKWLQQWPYALESLEYLLYGLLHTKFANLGSQIWMVDTSHIAIPLPSWYH